MKRIFVCICLIMSLVVAKGQEKYAGCVIEQTTPGANNMVWENDSIKFTFSPTDLFWSIKIENKTKANVECDWDKTLFIRNKKSSGIVFDNTIRMQKDAPKGTSIIASGTEILKSIFPLENWWETGAYPVFKKKSIKKEGNMIIRLIFPIKYGDSIREYEFSFMVSVPQKK